MYQKQYNNRETKKFIRNNSKFSYMQQGSVKNVYISINIIKKFVHSYKGRSKRFAIRYDAQIAGDVTLRLL